jgi:hypothetical protein
LQKHILNLLQEQSESKGDDDSAGVREKYEMKKSTILKVDRISLNLILRDTKIQKIFLALTMLCDIVIISDLNPVLKQKLAYIIKEFIQEEEFYLGCLVSSEEDHYLVNSGDLVISLMNKHKSNDYTGMVDMEISDFSGLSYLLFKHGNIIVAKIHQVFKCYNYREIFLGLFLLAHIIQSGLTPSIPFDQEIFLAVSGILYSIMGALHSIYYREHG